MHCWLPAFRARDSRMIEFLQRTENAQEHSLRCHVSTYDHGGASVAPSQLAQIAVLEE